MMRALIFGIPLAALGVAGWSAWQLQRSASSRTDSIVMMLPGPLPALNPFLPTTEVERQMVDLLHEPLIRLNGEGNLASGLADSWEWHQRMTCWFASVEEMREAQRLLAEVSVETRKKWELEEVTSHDLALVLRFAKPGGSGSKEALQLITSRPPLPVAFLRLTSAAETRPVVEEFLNTSELGKGVVRTWFGESGDCELVTIRPLFQMKEALVDWFRRKNQPMPTITPLAEVAGLLEPVLDFELNVSRAVWANGSPITAADVHATVAYVKEHGYPMAGREGFRDIQDITANGTTGVQVTYRRSYGAALASWVDFPILPAEWLKTHSQLGGESEPAPGAGEWLLKERSDRLLALELRGKPEPDQPRHLYCIPGTAALQTRVALATGALDVIWPGEDSELAEESALSFHPTPPRNRLLVLFNTRSSCLSEQPVREALALSFDLQAMLADGGPARPGEMLFAPGLWFAPAPQDRTRRMAEAVTKLEGAGWLKDVSGQAKKGGQSLTFELLVTTGNPQRERLARLLVKQWENLGARVNLTSVLPQELVSGHLASGKFDAVLIGLDYELAWDQTDFWHSSQMNGGMNFSQLADPQLDLLLEALADEFETKLLPARAQAVQDRLLVLQPALPLIGDLQQVGLRKARFPQIDPQDRHSPLTLRALLRTGSASMPRMRVPNE